MQREKQSKEITMMLFQDLIQKAASDCKTISQRYSSAALRRCMDTCGPVWPTT